MSWFSSHRDSFSDLEDELRRSRPKPGREFASSLIESLESQRRSARLATFSRLSFVGAATVLILGLTSSFGALSYAASGISEAVKEAGHVVLAKKKAEVPVVTQSAARTQYITTSPPPSPPPQTLTPPPTSPATPPLTSPPAAEDNSGGDFAPPESQSEGQPTVSPGDTGELPFTGFDFIGTVIAGLALVGLGLILRRRAGSTA